MYVYIYQQRNQNDVREQGREVDHFAGTLDALDEAGERNEPAKRQTEHQLPARIAPVVERRGVLAGADAEHVLAAISTMPAERNGIWLAMANRNKTNTTVSHPETPTAHTHTQAHVNADTQLLCV